MLLLSACAGSATTTVDGGDLDGDDESVNEQAASADQDAPSASGESAASDEDEPATTAATDAGLVAFVDGPYPERELVPMAGGWGYIHAPPPGAEVPGIVGALDALFIDCRDGDGGACDELYWQSVGELNSVGRHYVAFADTCGGRTVTERCTDLLGGTVPADGDPFDQIADKAFYVRNEQFDLSLIPAPTSAPPDLDAERDALWLQCGQGVNDACRELRDEALFFGIGDIYEAFGVSCGGRVSALGQGCEILMADDGVLDDGLAFIDAGSPAPGLLGSDADELWDACSTDPATGCSDLFFLMAETPGKDQTPEENAAEAPYLYWAETCGGVVDRPIRLFFCDDYVNWPVAG